MCFNLHHLNSENVDLTSAIYSYFPYQALRKPAPTIPATIAAAVSGWGPRVGRCLKKGICSLDFGIGAATLGQVKQKNRIFSINQQKKEEESNYYHPV